MISFLKSVYPALHAKRYYAAVNAGAYKRGDPTYNDGAAAINWWKQVGPYTDAMNED